MFQALLEPIVYIMKYFLENEFENMFYMLNNVHKNKLNILDLLLFKQNISESLMLGSQTTTPMRKSERPCNTPSASPVEIILLNKNCRVDPPNSLNIITKDKIDHFPVIDDLKHGTLCKNKTYKKRTCIQYIM